MIFSSVDFAVSVPRRNFYRGTVNLVMNTNALTVVTQPELAGSQMGEYYGFSLVAANLNLDEYVAAIFVVYLVAAVVVVFVVV